jgi:hypothetical protein
MVEIDLRTISALCPNARLKTAASKWFPKNRLLLGQVMVAGFFFFLEFVSTNAPRRVITPDLANIDGRAPCS